MTQISFYVLKGKSEFERQMFACRLAEKAYKLGNLIYIHTKDVHQSEQINKDLWAFRAESFVPHQLDTETHVDHCPILIGHEGNPQRLMDLLINLNDSRPLFIDQFKRMAELINDDNNIKITGRKRYQFYRQHAYNLEIFYI
ncbi:MAG: DNA polymerase III subunit chi [Piscirickettsiaceae bacterium]|nr:DNA polymerase III subunit chi [Piscirickettsiaceae bacterium]